MRTTLDIDTPILRELKRLARRQGISLGRLVSNLLAEALGRAASGREPAPTFHWLSASLGAPFDYGDREALWSALEGRGQLAVHEKKRK